jgi:hypothetical protein
MNLRSIIKQFLPEEKKDTLELISKIWKRNYSYGIMEDPVYNEDGLISAHFCPFLSDAKFQSAYNIAIADNALGNHPCKTQFRAYIACWAAQQVQAIDGDFVECGVNLGILSKTIVGYLDFQKQRNRTFFLFDTFCGIPESQLSSAEIKSGKTNKTFGYHDIFELAKKRFSEYENIKLIKGVVPDSLKNIKISKISYLSFDMNNAKAEIEAGNFFWDKIVSGGIVLLDDYAYGPEFVEQRIEWDIFAQKRNIHILTLPTGQGLIIKK